MTGHWLLAGGLLLLTLHGPDGQLFYVNPHEIVALRAPRGDDLGHFARGTRCILSTVDGHFIPVREDCEDVRNRLEVRP